MAINQAKRYSKRRWMTRFPMKLILNQPHKSNWRPSSAPELGAGAHVIEVSTTVFSCQCTTVVADCLEANDGSVYKFSHRRANNQILSSTSRQVRLKHRATGVKKIDRKSFLPKH